MGRSEREHPRVVDQNVDTAVSEFDRSSRHFARSRRVSKVRRNKIRLASCCADFGNRLLATFDVASYDQDMDAKLRQLIDCRPSNTARPSRYECCRCGRHGLALLGSVGTRSSHRDLLALTRGWRRGFAAGLRGTSPFLRLTVPM